MKDVELHPEEKLEFDYKNPFSEAMGRLSEYQGSITLPKKYYVVAKNAHLVARNYHVGITRFKRVILESLPRAASISLLAEAKLAVRSLAPRSHSVNGPAVSLVHRQASNYGHWLMDYLPRALAALHFRQETGGSVKVIVPDSLAPWQLRSLELIGFDEEDLIPISMNSTKVLNIKLEYAIFSRSHSFFSDPRYGCKDALSPLIFRSLKEKVIQCMISREPEHRTKKLFILRKSAGGMDRRFIINMFELKELLAPYGFEFIYLEDLLFDQQVELFKNASHVIAAHGSGLTNLIFSEGCHVLEAFSSGHGIRPEYWQLTAMTGGHYAHIVVNTEPPFHDMLIPLEKVKGFLELSS
ncbi:glycosyltransferase family 61 protein [Synechococcus sp. FGCU-3]|nr:glycosyltransferase family 61 protein [Synechococcus sp. FGCU3]